MSTYVTSLLLLLVLSCRIARAPHHHSLTRCFRVEADLGKFSATIYKKITADAKKERFQGFRPGTIPPHILPTYVAFAMDECAREATLEAMEQNNVTPFENARSELEFDTVSIPPPTKKGKKKRKKVKKKGAENIEADGAPLKPEVVEEPAWLTFETMEKAINAGWKVRSKSSTWLEFQQTKCHKFLNSRLRLFCQKYNFQPGQSFSFVAHDCRGQLVKDGSGATPIGEAGYRQGSMVDWNAIDISADKAT